jgi:hypothetical protein
VYCDHFAQDVVKKNDVLRAKNSKMDATRHRLIHMKICKHSAGIEELVEINFQKPTYIHQEDIQQQANVNHYFYKVDSAGVEFLLTDIHQLYYEISGACVEDYVGTLPPRNATKLIWQTDKFRLQLEF